MYYDSALKEQRHKLRKQNGTPRQPNANHNKYIHSNTATLTFTNVVVI